MVELVGRWSAEAALSARSVWDWWRGELLASVPEVLRRRLAGWRKRLVLVVGRDAATLVWEAGERCEPVAAIDLLAADPPPRAEALLFPGKPQSGKVPAARLRLDPAAALRVPMSLPLAALTNLAQVIEFEFDRFSPFKHDAVYFRHRIVARDAENARLEVELTLVPRDRVDDLRWRAERVGLRIVGIDVGGHPIPLPPEAAGGSARSAGRRFASLATQALLGLSALLALGLVGIPFLQAGMEIGELTDAVARAKQQADASTAIQSAIDSEIHDQSFVIDRKKGTPTVTEIVASLTRIMPDDVWLTELQIDGDNVQLSGFAASATAVLGLIDQSPLLSNAAFRSSVTQDAQQGRERFDITAQLRRKSRP